MTWKWQKPGWPNFTWDKARLALAEQQFLVGGGLLLGTGEHLGEDECTQLTVEVMSTEPLTTSEIEGEILDRASVQSSIQRPAWARCRQSASRATGATNRSGLG